MPSSTPDVIESLTYNVTVPAGTPYCYIVGAYNGWTPARATAMNKIDDTHYTVTLDEVSKSMEYKYICGQSWDYVELRADRTDVANRTWSENDVVEAWANIPNKDPETPGSLTYNVTVPEGTPACYIVGEFNGWDAGNAASMIKVDDTHYTITLDNVTTSSQYKYLNGLSWEYEEDRPDNANRTWSESDVVTAWKAIAEAPQEPEEPETLVYNVTVPEGTPACYIAGEMTAWTFLPMTQVDDTHYTITLMGVTKSMKYKYTCGEDWAYVEVLIDGSDSVDRHWSENDFVEAWKAIPEDGGVNSTIDNLFTVYGTNGAINIIAAQPTQVAIYNAQGILVALANANGNTTIELPGGLYIVNGNKVLVY